MTKKNTEANTSEDKNSKVQDETINQETTEKEQVVNEVIEPEVEELNNTDEDAEETPAAEEVVDQAAKLETEANEWKDKYLRLSAEFDNYRRRTLKEKMDLTKNAGESIFLKLLPVVDDFDRAMTSMKGAKDCDSILAGIDLINNKFKDFLKQQGLKEIESMHVEFDTDKHEALTKIPAPKKKLKGKVVDVIEKGYTLNDKVIRFSKVVVGE